MREDGRFLKIEPYIESEKRQQNKIYKERMEENQSSNGYLHYKYHIKPYNAQRANHPSLNNHKKAILDIKGIGFDSGIQVPDINTILEQLSPSEAQIILTDPNYRHSWITSLQHWYPQLHFNGLKANLGLVKQRYIFLNSIIKSHFQKQNPKQS